MPDLFTTSDATLSDCGKYRYHLLRVWDESLSRVCFCMLNPSTADASADDPTIRRCVNFAKYWGYGGLEVVNLFAWRATNPKDLFSRGVPNPIGPDNDAHIVDTTAHCAVTIAAWGANSGLQHAHCFYFQNRAAVVRPILMRVRVLGYTAGGHPRHPLYVAGNTAPLKDFD